MFKIIKKCMMWVLVFVVGFSVVAWIGGVGALLVYGHVLKSIGLFIIYPIIMSSLFFGILYFDTDDRFVL